MRTIAGAGTLRDRMFPVPPSGVLYGITVRSWAEPLVYEELAHVDYVLRIDGEDIPNGRYDLHDPITGAFFHVRKRPGGWEVVVGLTTIPVTR